MRPGIDVALEAGMKISPRIPDNAEEHDIETLTTDFLECGPRLSSADHRSIVGDFMHESPTPMVPSE
jgi:hypothetical protein